MKIHRQVMPADNDREDIMVESNPVRPELSLDVITIGRSSVDLYGQQIGSQARGHSILRQVGRRLPGQHRHRHGPPGPKVRPDHPRRQRADGPFHPRTIGA
jgi:hypothetical protein